MHRPDLDAIRAQFPALSAPLVFLENAGGSQVPAVVAERIREHLLERFVQLGAGYLRSQQATETVERAHTFCSRLMNGCGIGHTLLGPSTTQLLSMLADCMAPTLAPGDEILVAESGHEANVGPWVRLAERLPGVRLRWWRVERGDRSGRMTPLTDALSERTRILAFPQVSNLLGEVLDVAAICAEARRVGATTVVDGVAFAPHRPVDVAAWGCDWFVYSTYKVYGPHAAAMFGRREAFAPLAHPYHFFIPRSDVVHAFEPGGVSHEAAAGILALGEYLAFLVGEAPTPHQPASRETIAAAFARMAELEAALLPRLAPLLDLPGTTVVGPAAADARRVPTLSLLLEGRSSREVAATLQAQGLALRHGHMYAHRLCEALSIDPADGVVRISAVHTNTPQEIDRVVAAVAALARP